MTSLPDDARRDAPHLFLAWEVLSAPLLPGLSCQAQKETARAKGSYSLYVIFGKESQAIPSNKWTCAGGVRLLWQSTHTQLILKSPVARSRSEMPLCLWSIKTELIGGVDGRIYPKTQGRPVFQTGICRKQPCEFRTLVFVTEAWLIKGIFLPTFFVRGIWTGEAAVALRESQQYSVTSI